MRQCGSVRGALPCGRGTHPAPRPLQPPARATSTHQYRVAPTVDANEIEVSWSQHNRDAIVMRNTGRAFTDYGQPVTITLSFSNGFTTRWNPDTDVTVRPAPARAQSQTICAGPQASP